MSKREAVLCDKRGTVEVGGTKFKTADAPLCPNQAIATCSGCGEDICPDHTKKTLLRLMNVNGDRAGDDLVITVCHSCSEDVRRAGGYDTILKKFLAEEFTVVLKARLAAQQLKE